MAARIFAPVPGQIKSQTLSTLHAIAIVCPQSKDAVEVPTAVLRLEDHLGEVLTCDFHPSGKLFLSAGTDRRIHVGDVYGDCRKQMVMSGHTGAVTEAHFSRDGFDVYTCSNDRTLGIWDTFTGIRTVRLDGHTAGVNSVQNTRSGANILCSGSSDGTVRIWDPREEKCTLTFFYGSRVSSTCFDRSGDYVMAGGHSNDIKIWDVRANKNVLNLRGHSGAVTGTSLSPCGTYLLTHGKDDTLRIWQVSPMIAEQRCVGLFHTNPSLEHKNLMRCTWSPDGTKISGGSPDNKVYVWDALDGRMLCELAGHENSVTDVAFHPDEPVMLSASSDTFLLFHEVYHAESQ